MKITDVTPQTLHLLETGLRALAQDLGDPFRASRDTLEAALFSENPACHAVLATDDGRLGGITLFSPLMSTVVGTPGVYVSDLWIAAEARGSGLGARLLAAAAQRAHTRWQASFLKLTTYDDNPGAIAFYRRLGFEPHRGETVLRLGGTPFDDLTRTE